MTSKKRQPKLPTSRDQGPESKKPALSPAIQRRIGRQLQDLYVGVVQQGVPDRFTELLRRLDAKEASRE